jgi:hypothetical protein
MVRPNLAVIEAASTGRGHVYAVGDRVRIVAAGLYSGEIGTVETLAGGVIPAVVVRMPAGTRRVRTVDLEPVNERAEAERAEAARADAARDDAPPEAQPS